MSNYDEPILIVGIKHMSEDHLSDPYIPSCINSTIRERFALALYVHRRRHVYVGVCSNGNLRICVRIVHDTSSRRDLRAIYVYEREAKRTRKRVCTCVCECVCGRASGNGRYEGRERGKSDKGRGYVEEVEEEYRDRGTKGQGKD